ALETYTRDRVPLDWAMTQNNLGNALLKLGEHESGTAALEEAWVAYDEALKEYTPEADPYRHSKVKGNLTHVILLMLKRQGE
ncbi:MAG: hypothetical protein WB816_02505, partial [Methylocystis sp.]